MGVEHVESVADLACRTALAFRGVANITIPTDVQMSEKQNRSARNLKHHTSRHFAGSASIPNPACSEGSRDSHCCKESGHIGGSGAMGAGDQLERVADILGAPIVKALLGKPRCSATAHTPPAASDFWGPSHCRKRWKVATLF